MATTSRSRKYSIRVPSVPRLIEVPPVIAQQDLHAQITEELCMTVRIAVDAATSHRQQDERGLQVIAHAEVERRVPGRRTHHAVAVELDVEFEPRRHWTAHDEAENPFLWPIAREEVAGLEV